MSEKMSSYLRKQFLLWFIANIIGFGVLGISLLLFPSIVSISGIGVVTLITTIPISLAQWIALRRILQTSILWILTIPIGVPLAILIISVIPDGLWQVANDESIATLTSLYFLIGFAIGLPQWLILRLQLSGSSIWLLGSSIATATSFWIIFVTNLINQSGIISYIVWVLVYAIITGLTLSHLLVYHNQSQTKMVNAL